MKIVRKLLKEIKEEMKKDEKFLKQMELQEKKEEMIKKLKNIPKKKKGSCMDIILKRKIKQPEDLLNEQKDLLDAEEKKMLEDELLEENEEVESFIDDSIV